MTLARDDLGADQEGAEPWVAQLEVPENCSAGLQREQILRLAPESKILPSIR